MDSLDQLFRMKKGSYRVYQDTINKIDQRNIARLVQIIDSCGVPTEEMIGTGENFEIPIYYIILHHNAQQRSLDSSRPSITEKLISSLKNGQLDPYIYTYLVELQNDKSLPNYSHTSLIMLESEKKWRYFPHQGEKLNTINKNRKSIGLENEDDYRNKIIFSIINKEFKFSHLGSKSVHSIDKKFANSLFKNSIVVDLRKYK